MVKILAVMLAVLSGISAASAQAPGAVALEPSFTFETTVQGAQIEHAFVIRNQGATPLRITGLRMTPPLTVASLQAQIDPGAESAVRIRLDTNKVLGDFEGDIEVVLNDPAQTILAFHIEGRVVRTVEVAPLGAFFVAGQRGKGGTGDLEIINHGAEPLRILGIDYPSQRFSVAVTTIEDGRRYRLRLTMAPDGPGGRAAEPIVVRTSSAVQPELTITANTYLRERVYAFPDTLDFGSLPLAAVRANPGALVQTLMVYRLESSGFEATFSADGPVSISAERGPDGDRVQATVALKTSGLAAGQISGTVQVRTNDRAFPTLTIPYTLTVVP